MEPWCASYGEQLIAQTPFEIIHFDFLSMPESEKGLKFLLVIKDGFSGHVELVPSASAIAEVVADALLSYFSRFGVVSIWVTDQGTHFRNRVIEELARLMKCRTTSLRLLHTGLTGQLRERIRRSYVPSVYFCRRTA
jgi:hypothetical protein